MLEIMKQMQHVMKQTKTLIDAIAQLVARSLAARSARNLKMSLWLRNWCVLHNTF